MKRAQGHGLFLSIILNMLFRAGWLALVAILLILHFALGWPIWLIFIPIGCWIAHAVIITLVLGWANSSSSGPEPAQNSENKNPYSSKNSDYYRK